ncbi:MAG: hypothetical protein AB8B85_15390 [Paracoccaceae bacterium]
MSLTPQSKKPFDAAALKSWFTYAAIKATVTGRGPQAALLKAMREYIVDDGLREAVLVAKAEFNWFPPEIADGCPYKLAIKVAGVPAGGATVIFNTLGTGPQFKVGFGDVSSSGAAAKLLKHLQSTNPKFSGLTLRDVKGKHAGDVAWEMGSFSGSLPMTSHTKSKGGNEKAALNVLKKSMKALGFV